MITLFSVLRRCRLSFRGDSVVLLLWLAIASIAAGCGGTLSPLAPSTSAAPAPTPTSLVGHVVQRGASTGIASAQLTLVDSSGNVLTATTDGTGAFSFDNLTAGTYELQAVAAGFLTSDSTLTFPVSSYTVQLAPDGPPPTVTIVSVIVSGPASVALGGSIQMTATATYTDGSRRDVSNVANWSAAPSIVSISPSGLATAYATGSTVVVAAFDSTTGSLPVTVTSR